MKKFSIPIVFCTDEAFTSHLAVTMISLMESNKEFIFQFILLSSDVNKEKIDKLKALVNSRKSEFRYIDIDPSDFEGFPIIEHISKAAYYRINIPKILNEKTVLYLDADIVCVGDISGLLKLDLADMVLAAVIDPVYKWHEELKMTPGSKYFNSGVMLINTKAWNEAKISERVLDFIHTNPEKIRFVDQCGLNAVIDGAYLELSAQYNQQAIFFRKDINFSSTELAFEEIERAKIEPLFIHYTGPSKPWHYNNNHPYKQVYWNFQASSPFKLNYPVGMKLPDHFKSVIPKNLKQYVKKLFE